VLESKTSYRSRHRKPYIVGNHVREPLSKPPAHAHDQQPQYSLRIHLLSLYPNQSQSEWARATGQPMQLDHIPKASSWPCPNSLSHGESFHTILRALNEDGGSYRGDLRKQEQKAPIEAPSTHVTSSGRGDQEQSTGQAAIARPSGLEKSSCAGRDSTWAMSPSPRKRRRSNIAGGPQAPIPRRRSSVPVRRKGQDLISFHRQSCQLFQSLEGTLASSRGWKETDPARSRRGSSSNTRPSSPCIIKTDNGFAYLASTTSTSPFGSAKSSRRNSSAAVTPLPSLYDDRTPTSTSSSFRSLAGTSCSILEEKLIRPLASLPPRPHPVSITSWTSVESRRCEYEKIDRSHSGLRGLWKRLTPRWCHGGRARKGFFDGTDAETQSVRRYRLTLDDDDDDDDSDEKQKRREKERTRSCLSLRRR
jgi:hypothetical protein